VDQEDQLISPQGIPWLVTMWEGGREVFPHPETRLVYVETPTNSTMVLTDIQAAAQIAHHHGALLVVDNTFASPYRQRPLEHGADVVVHSLTKFVNGHSDVLGGMIVTKEEESFNKMRRILSILGSTMDPHQAWLILRGMQTLPVRMEKAQANAALLAAFLSTHPKVTGVRYPPACPNTRSTLSSGSRWTVSGP